MSVDRGLCPRTGKSRFSHDEAVERAHAAKMRGHSVAIYRCKACDGWWHTTHAADNDGRGGGKQQRKKRKPSARQRRALRNLTKGGNR